MEVLSSNEFYEISGLNEIAILQIKPGVFDHITDLELSRELVETIARIDRNRNFKALVFYNDRDSFTNKKYEVFLNRILEKKPGCREHDEPCFQEKNMRFREVNMLNHLIKSIASLQLLVVSGIQGEVVTPFVGASLVADFRFASETATLSMIHNKYGLHPSGAMPFFLSNYLHHSKAMEFQLQDKIDANEAMGLGLFNKLLPDENFVDHLIKETQRFTNLKYCTIRDTKRLTTFNRKSLNDYFDFEASLLNL
ncbi:MAG: enoyl-CoA hydratase/isomerase family protein [Bacteroidales bacterium]|nr:enoyl-CoA hydratase/isomerase family protein [Bacteroidales bacterium]MCF8405116.1 enoyl-CoA hydratase/isomerase family protein [Bacteroidales bacterium]